MMLSILGRLRAFSVYRIFNLRWVIWKYLYCEIIPSSVKEDLYVTKVALQVSWKI